MYPLACWKCAVKEQGLALAQGGQVLEHGVNTSLSTGLPGPPSKTAKPPRPHYRGAGSESRGNPPPWARTGVRGHAALAQQRQRLRSARQRRQVGRGRAGQRQQVQRAGAQPQPVARALRLEPARQRVRGLDQQELAVVVPHARGRAGDGLGQAAQQPGGKPLVVDGVPKAQAAPQAGQRRLRRPAPGRRRGGGGREAERVQLPRVAGRVRRQLGHAARAQRVQGLRRAVCASHVFTCGPPTHLAASCSRCTPAVCCQARDVSGSVST